MPSRSDQPPRRPPERVLAWLYTGPVGHLWSAVADLGVFFFRSLYTRARRRIT